jgi:hypothetical protein
MKTSKIEFIVYSPKNIPKTSLKRFSWQSLIFYSLLWLKRNNDKTNANIINFKSTILKKKYGKDYRMHIDFLLKEKWIEENPRYKNGAGGFCKSFRVSEKNYPWIHKPHAIKLQKRIWEKFAGKFAKDTSDLSSYYLNLIHRRHNTLSLPLARSIAAKRLKIKLDRKLPNVRYGENDRVYSSIILSKKEARKDVIFGEYGKLINIDITGMVQQLLNKNIQDEKWNIWIKEDFPSKIIKHFDEKLTRDRVKELFMIAISKKCNSGLASEIRTFLDHEFPLLMSYVDELNQISSVQLETQKQEARIIKEFILKNERFEIIPAHDGLFCGEKIALEVQDYLEIFLKKKGLAGYTKIKPDNPLLRRRTTLDILEGICSD